MLLITGATGFIGRHLLKEFLSVPIPLIALYRSEAKKEETLAFLKQYKGSDNDPMDSIDWRKGTMNDWVSLEKAFEGVTHVVHTAAKVSLFPSKEDQMTAVNVEGTRQLIDLALKNNIEWFGHISSIAALGASKNHETLTDAELWGDEETFTAYGYSKYLAELEVWRGIEEGLKCCFFNPGVVLGLGTEQSPLNQLLAQQNKKNVWLTKGSTGFVAVEDVVLAVRLAYLNELNRGQFILVSENWTYEELFRQFLNGSNRKYRLRWLSKWQLQFLYRLELFLSLLGRKRKLSLALIKSLTELHTYDGDNSIHEIPSFNYSNLKKRLKGYLNANYPANYS